MRHCRHVLQIDIGRQRHPAGVDLQDLVATRLVRRTHADLPIEPAGTPQRRVDAVGQIGRRDHDDLAARAQTVHQGEQLSHDPLFDVA